MAIEKLTHPKYFIVDAFSHMNVGWRVAARMVLDAQTQLGAPSARVQHLDLHARQNDCRAPEQPVP